MREPIFQNRNRHYTASPKSRRDFLENAVGAERGTLVSFRPALLTGPAGMKVTKGQDHFSLNKFYPSLEGLTVPEFLTGQADR